MKFTVHPSFGRDISQWISKQVLLFKDILIPFHLPSCKVRELPHQSLKDFLHNFKDWDRWLQHHTIDEAPCPYHYFIHILSEQCLTRGHVVAGIEQLGSWHRSFAKLGAGSTSSAFFPAKHEFFKHNTKMFASWRLKHCLQPNFRLFIQKGPNYVWPPSRRSSQLQELRQLYIAKRFPASVLP